MAITLGRIGDSPAAKDPTSGSGNDAVALMTKETPAAKLSRAWTTWLLPGAITVLVLGGLLKWIWGMQ
jgi:hypothetical protein